MTYFLGMSDGEPERQRLCYWRTKINKLRGEAVSRGFSRFLEIQSALEAQRDEHVKEEEKKTVCDMSYFFSGGSHEKHQQHPSALPLHAARSLPQLHQVRSAGQHLRHHKSSCIFVLNNVSWIDPARFRIEQPVYINIIRDPINRFLSNYFFRRFGDWRGEQNHLIRTPGMKDDERYLVRKMAFFFCFLFAIESGQQQNLPLL